MVNGTCREIQLEHLDMFQLHMWRLYRLLIFKTFATYAMLSNLVVFLVFFIGIVQLSVIEDECVYVIHVPSSHL